MKLVSKKTKVMRVEVEKEEPKKKNTLPTDSYRDEIKPVRFRTGDNEEYVLSVTRKGELGLPYLDIRQHIETDKYTGFTKKGVTIPLELLEDLQDAISLVDARCAKKKL